MTMTPPPGEPKYRSDIDGLRAIAVIAVVAFHAFPGSVRGGFVGVDVFFVISGFLISTIILRNVQRERFSFRDFYARRVRRIFPALSLVLAACLLAGWFTLLPDEYAQLGKHVAGGAGFSANLVLLAEAGYFDTSAATKPLLHLWSLGIEEQFYFVWPLVIYVSYRWRRTAIVLGVIFVGSLAFNLMRVGAHGEETFYNPLTRFWELLVGAALAQLTLRSKGPIFVGPVRNVASIVGAALIAFATLRFHSELPFPGWRAMLPTLGAALWIAAGPDAFLNRVVLSNRLLVAIGLISYPLYLWHWPLLVFPRILHGTTPSALVRGAAIAIAFALSFATYRWLETPIRHGTVKRGGVVGMLVASIAALCVLGIAVRLTGGFARARGPWNVENVSVAFDEGDQHNGACRASESTFFEPGFDPKHDFCHTNRTATSHPDVVVVGDSHAGRIYSGIVTATDLAAVDLGRGSCLPLAGYEATNPGSDKVFGCSPTMTRLLERAPTLAPETIVLSGFFARNYDGRVVPKIARPLRELMRETLMSLSDRIPRIVVVLDVPEMPFEPSTCVDRPYRRHSSTDGCSFDRAPVERARALYEPDLKAAAEGLRNVAFFDPVDVMCDEKKCDAVREKRLLYDDPHHLSRYGAEIVATALEPLLTKRAR